MSIDSAFRAINESVEIVIEKLKELSKENAILKEENKELRKLIAELMIEQLEGC